MGKESEFLILASFQDMSDRNVSMHLNYNVSPFRLRAFRPMLQPLHGRTRWSSNETRSQHLSLMHAAATSASATQCNSIHATMRGAACVRNVKSDNRIAAISPLYTAAAAAPDAAAAASNAKCKAANTLSGDRRCRSSCGIEDRDGRRRRR